jgi:hypothetical protein
MKYGHRKGRFTRANASRLGKVEAAARERKRQERIATGFVGTEPERIPEGEALGVLTWHAADGTVRRWVITQGPRANNIGVVARVVDGDGERRVMGWDRLMQGLRKRLAIQKRRWRDG